MGAYRLATPGAITCLLSVYREVVPISYSMEHCQLPQLGREQCHPVVLLMQKILLNTLHFSLKFLCGTSHREPSKQNFYEGLETVHATVDLRVFKKNLETY